MSEKDKLFQLFCADMDTVLANDDRDYKDQSRLFNRMFKLEREFRKVLQSHKEGRDVYKSFLRFINVDSETMLDARIYFRERQATFTKKITKAFYADKYSMLYPFKINYMFVKWALDNYSGPKKKILTETARGLSSVRDELNKKNLPLAVNRAKMFSIKTRDTNVEYMDLIQLAAEGLVHAIDKFVPPYRYVFGTTAIGRMTSNMSEELTGGIVKMSPKDKRILYRARNAKSKQGIEDPDEVAKYVSESFEGTTTEKLSELYAAAEGTLSLDMPNEENETMLSTLASKDNPEENIEKLDLIRKLVEFMPELTILERKVIRLKYGIM